MMIKSTAIPGERQFRLTNGTGTMTNRVATIAMIIDQPAGGRVVDILRHPYVLSSKSFTWSITHCQSQGESYLVRMENLRHQLYRMRIHHLVFWLLYYAFFGFLYWDYYASPAELAGVISIYAFFHAGAFYLINYYLVPRYLHQRRHALFLLFVAATFLLSGFGLGTGLYLAFRATGAWKLMTAFLTGFSSIVLMVGTLSLIKLIADKMRHDKRAALAEQNRVQSELQFLRAQVNPHFLFNAINSIHVLIRKDPEKAADTLIRLSELLRFQLYDCADEKIPIEKELTYIRNFILLEQVRRGDLIKVKLTTEGDLSGFEIAPFLSVPFLENAFKFVSSHSDKRNEVTISIKRMDNDFEASFFNTKDDTQFPGPGGIGLKNVQRRLQLLYPGKHKITLEKGDDSWLSVIQLKLS